MSHTVTLLDTATGKVAAVAGRSLAWWAFGPGSFDYVRAREFGRELPVTNDTERFVVVSITPASSLLSVSDLNLEYPSSKQQQAVTYPSLSALPQKG